MSLKGTLDRTRPAALLAPRSLILSQLQQLSSALTNPAAAAPSELRRAHTRSVHHQLPRSRLASPRPPPLSPLQMDNIFIQALVQAGSCRRHAKHTGAGSDSPTPSPLTSNHHRSRWKGSSSAVYDGLRGLRTGNVARDEAEHPKRRREISLEELKKLVREYEPADQGLRDEEREAQEAREQKKKDARRGEGPETAQPKRYDRLGREWHHPWPTYGGRGSIEELEVGAKVDELCKFLDLEEPQHEVIFEVYKSLPHPRVAYLKYPMIRKLTNVMAVVQYKRYDSMLRYLSIIDDMKAANIPIALADWTTAVNFAGSCFRQVTTAEIESALYVWREMEDKAGVKGSNVTFNILFHLARKAGKYALVEMILKEMEKRGLTYDRYFRTDYIVYQGIRGNGDGVRKAYKDLVDQGEIVDTAVMNAVLTALISAGEATGAEQVFLRMKALAATRIHTTVSRPSGWRQMRDLGITLNRAAIAYRHDPEMRKQLQEAAPIIPDVATYKILVDYHAQITGNIDRVTELLAEMDQTYNLPIQGSFFFRLLRGFSLHGGVRYTSWTRSRLEIIWSAFLTALDGGTEGFFLGRPVVDAAVCAFAKCAGKERTMLIWEDLRGRWQPEEEDLEALGARLRKLFPAQPYQ